jgi:hypothetical protein
MPLTEVDILRDAAGELNEAIRTEFSLQGHTLTGAAERSLHATIVRNGNRVDAVGEAVEYMKTLDEGVPTSQIKVTDQYVRELANYVTLRMGYTGKKALKVAFLIARKHMMEGMPTEASSQFSQTGERKGFFKAADDDPSNKTEQVIDTGIDRMMYAVFSKQQSETV